MNYTQNLMSSLQLNTPGGIMMALLWLALVAWSLYWKGIALWKAARLYDKNWFIFLLIINLFGALEIYYIYFVAKPKEEKLKASGQQQ